MIKSLKSFDLKNKRILIRVDFNVPIKDDSVVDDFRIRAALSTIEFCIKSGAKVILMSHLGRPNSNPNPVMSLIPAGETLSDLLEMPIKFSRDCVSEDAHDVTLGLRTGEIHLLENTRFHRGEIENDPHFSSALAKHGQIFINDAFATAHRSHASNVGVAKNFVHKGMGFLVETELQYLSDAMETPAKPFTIILGGAKIGSKLGLIQKFIRRADHILIGGGMAFTFLKVQGKDVGKSLVDTTMIDTAKRIMALARGRTNLLFPQDVVCAESMENANNSEIQLANHIPNHLMGLDIGPKTVERFTEIISESGTILLNGPMGVFELEGFHKGTEQIALQIAKVTEKGAKSIIGGGDSASAIKKFGLMSNMSHVSTGGGASLELLSGNTLPALYSLEI